MAPAMLRHWVAFMAMSLAIARKNAQRRLVASAPKTKAATNTAIKSDRNVNRTRGSGMVTASESSILPFSQKIKTTCRVSARRVDQLRRGRVSGPEALAMRLRRARTEFIIFSQENSLTPVACRYHQFFF